jgi:transposase
VTGLVNQELLLQNEYLVIVDNYSTHKHRKVRTWLARRRRYHVHYTPTYSSWLNQVELWFGLNHPARYSPRLL